MGSEWLHTIRTAQVSAPMKLFVVPTLTVSVFGVLVVIDELIYIHESHKNRDTIHVFHVLFTDPGCLIKLFIVCSLLLQRLLLLVSLYCQNDISTSLHNLSPLMK